MNKHTPFSVERTMRSGRKAVIRAHDASSYCFARNLVEIGDKNTDEDAKFIEDDRNWFRARPKRRARVRPRPANEQPAAGPGSHMLVVRLSWTPTGRARIPISREAAIAFMDMSKLERDRAAARYLEYLFELLKEQQKRQSERVAILPQGATIQ